jgi:hypothetical protein
MFVGEDLRESKSALNLVNNGESNRGEGRRKRKVGKATSDKGRRQNPPLQTTSPDHKYHTTTVAL